MRSPAQTRIAACQVSFSASTSTYYLFTSIIIITVYLRVLVYAFMRGCVSLCGFFKAYLSAQILTLIPSTTASFTLVRCLQAGRRRADEGGSGEESWVRAGQRAARRGPSPPLGGRDGPLPSVRTRAWSRTTRGPRQQPGTGRPCSLRSAVCLSFSLRC